MAPRDVLVFVFDSLSDWEAGYAAAGINSPAFQRHPGRYRIRTVAVRPEPVTTMGGIRIMPDLTFGEADAHNCAMLILPGGTIWDQGGNAEAVEAATSCLDAGIPVAGICGATAGLARGGLLDARRHTSNAIEYLAATGYQGAALYVDAPAVTDGDLITASGMAALEFARHIFLRLDLYEAAVLDAWYGLFKTGRPEYYASLISAATA